MTKIHDALLILDRLFPPSLADRDDPTGVQVGDLESELKGISIALEATVDTIQAAANNGSNLLITHHPLIYRPIAKLIASDPSSRAIMEAVKLGVCVISCHTNADWAHDGLNDFIAGILELNNLRPLEARFEYKLFKLVTFVPPEKIDAVSEAIFTQGAGVIGDYKKCSFRIDGTGTFMPQEGTDPYSGSIGQLAKENEIRLEALVKSADLNNALEAMIEAHPYEEVAYDLFPLHQRNSQHGVARLGVLNMPQSPRKLAEELKIHLKLEQIVGIGPVDEPVERVAICTGAGAALLPQISQMNSTVYVSGDIRYHDARFAEQAGLPVLDIGHFDSEIHFVEMLVGQLGKELEKASKHIKVHGINIEKNPFISI